MDIKVRQRPILALKCLLYLIQIFGISITCFDHRSFLPHMHTTGRVFQSEMGTRCEPSDSIRISYLLPEKVEQSSKR